MTTASNTQKHTPTPWAQSDSMPHLIFKDALGMVDFNHPVAAAGDDKKGLANAAFIVRACNAHDELVEALDAALNMLRNNATASPRSLDAISDALAKARGEA